MSNSKITFSDLKHVNESLLKGYTNVFIDYLNSFEGKDTHEKFKSILKTWEFDVSYTLSFNINKVSTKIQLSYINSQFQNLSEDITIKEDDLTIVIGVPTEFEAIDTIPIYNIVKYIDISGIFINLSDLSFHDKRDIIDKLPAHVYNVILKHIKQIKDKTFSVDNSMLSDFKINFLSTDPVTFLKGMFENYDDLYFKDVIYHLSKRIGGDMVMKSTPLEIEYFIEKASHEVGPDTSINI